MTRFAGGLILSFIALSTFVAGQEKSVNPGINKSFENPAVPEFIERFERDGRDAFDHRDQVVAALELKPGMNVADVGAGTGLFTRLFAPRVGPAGRVYAVDISEKFVAHIEQSAAQAKLSNVVGVVCTADDVRLPPASVDLVFICDTYHHFEFPQATLRSIHKALKPEGRLVLIDFHRIEGQSSDWVLGHVRAGQEVFTQEIVAAGFQQVDERQDILKESYFVTFKRRARTSRADDRLVPLPRVVPAPRDNPTTPAKVTLGKQLFFDPRLSGDNTMSCATCHIPAQAFGDGVALNRGHAGKRLSRNTQSCLNVGFFTSFFWDGRAATLEAQALGPIQSPDEMHQDLQQLEVELRAVPDYAQQFQAVFQSPPDRQGIARALAAYQRTLVTGLSAYDRYLLGDDAALSADAKRGLALFQGEARCIECHHGPLLSDGKFYRLGGSQIDEGRAKVTGQREDRYRFRTPSLRNVAETGPYLHDGSLQTLDQVITFYYRGITRTSSDGLTSDAPDLSSQSLADIPFLVAFLNALSGSPPDTSIPTLPPGPDTNPRRER